MNYWEATGYLGIPAMALAVAAPIRRPGARLLWLLVALGLAMPLGAGAPFGLHRLLSEWLPGFGSFRVPTRSLMVVAFLVAILAAEGLEARLRVSGRGPRSAWRSLAVVAAACLAVLVLPTLPGYPFRGGLQAPGTRVILGVGVATAGWLLVVHRGWRGLFAAVLAVALALGEGVALFAGFNDVGPAEEEAAMLGEVAPLVPPAPAPRRVGVVAKWGQTANATLRRGWEGVTGYGPMAIQRVRELIEATRSGEIHPLRPVTADTNFPRPHPTSPLWALFAAPVVVSITQ